jgi:hypothetical protein
MVGIRQIGIEIQQIAPRLQGRLVTDITMPQRDPAHGAVMAMDPALQKDTMLVVPEDIDEMHRLDGGRDDRRGRRRRL